jgi:DNA-binding XRE family transcriptional regulator
MNREELEKHVKDIIMFNYGWDMWSSRSQESYDEGIQPFIEQIAELVEKVSRGEKPKKLHVYEDDIHSDLNVVIGGRLRELRREKGVSLAKMAERIGIDAEYYSDLERGAAWMRTIDLQDALAVLGVGSAAVLPF